MKAFWTVARLELRIFHADRLLAAALVSFLACAAFGFWSGSRTAAELAESGRRTLADERELLSLQRDILAARERAGEPPSAAFYDPSNPGAVGVFAGRYAVLLPSPWAALALGQSDVIPDRVLVTTQSRWTLGDTTDTENPLLLALGRLDLAFVFVVLYPLIIIAASYDLVSRERELGRLALILAQPTTPRRVLGARLLGRALPLIGLGVAVSLIGFASLGPDAHTAHGGLRALLWCLLVAAYGLFWFGGAVFINGLGLRSAQNALILLAAWLAFVVVVPSTFDVGLEVIHPLPSRVERSLLARAASRDAEARADELLGSYYRDHPELSPSAGGPALDFLPRYLAVTEQVDRAVAPVFESFDAALRAQREASARLRFLSPALVLEWALCDLAGTGSHRVDQFRAAVREYQQHWRAFFLPLAFEKRPLSPAHFDILPEFRFEDEPSPRPLGRAALALAALLGSAMMLSLLALQLGWRLSPFGRPERSAARLASAPEPLH